MPITQKKAEKSGTLPIVRKLTALLRPKHNDMFEKLVAFAKVNDHRANMTTVIEDAIERAYDALPTSAQ